MRRALGEAGRARRQDHELLEVDLVVGVRAAVQDVHHRQRQQRLAAVGEPAVQALARVGGGRVRGGERHAEQRVRAEPRLRFGAVELDHLPVQRRLLGQPADGQAAHRARQLAVRVRDRAGHALAAVALAAVAQLERLAAARRRARGHGRAAAHARVELDVDLERRVAARVENLARAHFLDSTHGGAVYPSARTGDSRRWPSASRSMPDLGAVDRGDPLRGQHLGGRAAGGHPPALEQDELVGEARREHQVVGHQRDPAARRARQPAAQPLEAARARGPGPCARSARRGATRRPPGRARAPAARAASRRPTGSGTRARPAPAARARPARPRCAPRRRPRRGRTGRGTARAPARPSRAR